MLDREEYVEQGYLFRMLGERMLRNMPLQEVLAQAREEILATTRLPHAIDFMLAELKHVGQMSAAMQRLPHYFAPFQTYLMTEAESEHGRFDLRVALDLLSAEALFRAGPCTPQALFLFQFEALCRNRLKYDKGLAAVANDDFFNADWKEWILTVRRQIGLVDLADMVYVRSDWYVQQRKQRGEGDGTPEKPVLFGEKEGRIALANRRRDPLYLFASLQRHLNYPAVPRPKKPDDTPELLPQLMRRMERLEVRMKLTEEEQKGGFDLTKFYGPQPPGLKPDEPFSEAE